MQIVRFRAGDTTRYGVLEGSHVVEYTGTPYTVFRRARKRYALKHTVLLMPVVPTKIVAIGSNYRDHAEELNRPVPSEPIIFLKPVSSLCGPDDPIVFPPEVKRVDHEAELAIVIKKRCHRAAPDRARDHVLGYTCLNDVTARDLLDRDGQWTRGKSFDSFCPVGPCIATDIDPNGVDIETYVNGEQRQASNTKHCLFPVEDLVARVSAVMTLLPGDVITTGTPSGVGPIWPGDKVEIRIAGIGSLKNPVVRL